MENTVVSLHVYPVKALRGIEVASFELDVRGPQHDRQFMLVDAANGQFLSQRATPVLAQFSTALETDGLVVIAPDGAQLTVPFDAEPVGRRTVSIWKDRVEAIDCGNEPAKFFSSRIGFSCRMVRMPDDVDRVLDPKFVDAAAQRITGFSDGYPLLVANTASLDELNTRLVRPVEMKRFRPNIVVKTSSPWVEDAWAALRVGELMFDGVKPCSRCTVITTDQHTGERPDGNEPLKTLTSYRMKPGFGAIFGMNLVARAKSGVVRVGDAVLPIISTSLAQRA